MLEAWEKELPALYPRRQFLLAGIKDGFRITNKDAPTDKVFVDNYRSSTAPTTRGVVEQQIQEEIDNGRYIKCRDPRMITSALGAIPKPASDKIRLIHDCSRPLGKAVNDRADNRPFSYQSLQQALAGVSRGTWMAKLDLASAYRSVKISEKDYDVTGLAWTFEGEAKPTYLYDTRLMFGARLAPSILNELSQAVVVMMKGKGYHHVYAYCDDFLIAEDDKGRCLEALNTLWRLCRRLGFAISYNKILGPATSMTFLGTLIDTSTMTLALPQEKLQETKSLLGACLRSNTITKKKLQRIGGKLNWACRVIQEGRYFVSSVYKRIRALKGATHKSRVSGDLKEDLCWWMDFMSVFNGSLPIRDSRPQSPVVLDACPIAGGAVYEGHWLYVPWRGWAGMERKHINCKEILILEPAAHIFGPFWRNKSITVYTDNTTAMACINKRRSDDEQVMASLKRVCTLAARYNFSIRAIHYPGVRNTLADACSRLHTPGYDRVLAECLATTFLHYGESTGEGGGGIQSPSLGSQH